MKGNFFAVLPEVSVDTWAPIKSKGNMHVITYFTSVSLIKIVFYGWTFLSCGVYKTDTLHSAFLEVYVHLQSMSPLGQVRL